MNLPNIDRPSFAERMVTCDTWLVELFLAFYTILWGVWYANPLINTMAQNPSQAILAQFPGGETAFGLFATTLGVLKLLTSISGDRRARATACAVLGTFWLGVAVAIGIPSHWSAGGIPHFLLVSATSWYLWGRLRYRGLS
jgi:hypothetical protein